MNSLVSSKETHLEITQIPTEGISYPNEIAQPLDIPAELLHKVVFKIVLYWSDLDIDTRIILYIYN